jgi:hypothetical protein
MADYSTETHVRVYNDEFGYYYTVRPDRDGLDGVELFYNEGDGKSADSPAITMDKEAAFAVGIALIEAAGFVFFPIEKDDDATPET